MRWLAYMACGVVLLAGPAVAQEYSEQSARSPNWECNRPVSQLSMVQIERCRTKMDAAQELLRLVCPAGESKCGGPTVIRGSR